MRSSVRNGRRAGWIAVVSALCWAAPAATQQSWSVEEDSAVALLPPSEQDGALVAGTFACAEQKWTLDLSRQGTESAVPDIVGAAQLSIGRESFEARTRVTAEGIEIAVPHEALEPLKAGLRLTVAAADGTETTFSLRGSRRAITAMEERCSPRPLPSENRVVFSPYSSHLKLAERLREEDIRTFRAATSADPKIAAAMTPLDHGSRLLFVEMCGSSWYYGQTGCNIAVFAQEGSADGWQQVLDWEGAAVYLDPENATGDWPDMTILPIKGPGEEQRLSWDGGAYAVMDAMGDTTDAAE